jgi:hypothetical protein
MRVRLSELPPQTARDAERDAANIERVEQYAASGGLILRQRYQSDTHIKWVVPQDCAVPVTVAALCEVGDGGGMKILMIPRSYETMYVRWVDTVPYLSFVLALASAGIWVLMFR